MKKDVAKVLIIILILFFIDQAIKIYIGITKPTLEIIHDLFSIKYVENNGSAFGIGGENLLTIIVSNFIVLGIAIKFMITQFERIDECTKIMLCMVLAGGVSNLLDRIVRGYVIDYISVSSFPVFNLADIAITTGAGLLLLSYILENKKK